MLVCFKKGCGGGFIAGPFFGFPDPEGQMVPVPFDEFEGVFGFGGGIKLGGLEFLNLLHIVSYRYGYTIDTNGKKIKIIFTFYKKEAAPIWDRLI